MKNKLFLSKKQILILISVFVYNKLIYNGVRFITANKMHYNLMLPFEQNIPFMTWTVLIYWGCVIQWTINYIIGVLYDKGNGYRFVGAHFIGEMICFVIYIIFPTFMDRPEITGSSVFDWVLKMTYANDKPDNLFPSIHCFISWLCWIGVRNNAKIPKWYQLFSFIMAILVFISTLTVKQHVLVDIPAGLLVAELSYYLSGLIFNRKKKVDHEKYSEESIS